MERRTPLVLLFVLILAVVATAYTIGGRASSPAPRVGTGGSNGSSGGGAAGPADSPAKEQAPQAPRAPATPTPAAPASPAPGGVATDTSVSILPRAYADDKAQDGALSLAGGVPVDQFNDGVKDKKAGDEAGVRGGMIRVRFPIDPKSMCPVIDNDAPTQTVYSYMNDSLLDRDPETFEWIPILSRYWVTRDVIVLKDGRRLEGRVQSEDDKEVVFAEGASKWTIARHEVTVDEGTGRVTWKDGLGKGSIEGRLSGWPGGRWTIDVDEKPSKTVEIAQSDVATVEEDEEGRKVTYPGVIRECIYEFKMRPGLKWHDGQALTVDDILFTYADVIMNKSVLCGHIKAAYDDNMDRDVAKAVSKVADDVVRFQLRKQYYAALGQVCNIYVLPKHRYGIEKYKGDAKGFGDAFNSHPEHAHPVGSGRYRFSKWETNKYVEIVRNDDWWASRPGQGVPWIKPQQPYLDKIQWITIENKNASIKALQNGEVDADFEIEQIDWVGKDTNSEDFTKRFVRAQYLSTAYTYIGWNLRRPDVDAKHAFFKDPKVRLAMAMLIDREKILKNIHYGLGEMVTGPFFSKGPFCDRSIKPIEFNPEKGKTLLDQAGWVDHDGDGVRDKDGVPFQFTYNVHSARDYHLKIAEIVKQDIEKAGIKVDIKVTDFNSFIDIVNSRKFDAIRFAWGEPDCVDTDPYQIWHSSQWDNKGSNHTGYANAEVDELITKARRELDFRKRQRAFRKVHRLIHEDQPYTFLFNLYDLYFYGKKYRNVKFYIVGNNPYRLDEWFVPKDLQEKK